jgi:hypothetical protein
VAEKDLQELKISKEKSENIVKGLEKKTLLLLMLKLIFINVLMKS